MISERYRGESDVIFNGYRRHDGSMPTIYVMRAV